MKKTRYLNAFLGLCIITVCGLSIFLVRCLRKSSCIEKPRSINPCSDGWLGIADKCYYFSVDTGNWSASISACKSANAELVIYDNVTIEQVIRYANINTSYWLNWEYRSSFEKRSSMHYELGCIYVKKIPEVIVSVDLCNNKRSWICIKNIYL